MLNISPDFFFFFKRYIQPTTQAQYIDMIYRFIDPRQAQYIDRLYRFIYLFQAIY